MTSIPFGAASLASILPLCAMVAFLTGLYVGNALRQSAVRARARAIFNGE